MAELIRYGDTDGTIAGRDGAGDQTVPDPATFYYGDFERALVFGDAEALAGSANGGDDTVGIGSFSRNNLFGDARTISEDAAGGNDVVQTGGFSNGYGDALEMTGRSQGGDDLLRAYGGTGAPLGLTNSLYGDAFRMGDDAQGGDDTLTGSDESAFDDAIYGDAYVMTGRAQGGDDRIVSNYAPEEMWGDARVMAGEAEGGRDVFVLTTGIGSDTIHDFEPGKDRIDLSFFTNLGLRDFAGLAQRVVEEADAIFVVLDAPGFAAFARVVVEGAAVLNESDFVFG